MMKTNIYKGLALVFFLLLVFSIYFNFQNYRPGQAASLPRAYLLENVNVPLLEENTVLENYNVLMVGDQVKTISGEEIEDLPGNTTVINSEGLYLVPGLTNMHAHLNDKSDLRDFIIHGVTTVRVAAGAPSNLRWREAINEGHLIGPKLFVASPFIWDKGPVPFATPIDTPEMAREVVQRYTDEGYDALKLVDSYNYDVTAALMDEVRKQGMRLFGHIPVDNEDFNLVWTAEQGMWTIEHLEEVARLAFAESGDDEDIQRFVEVAKKYNLKFTSLFTPLFYRQMTLQNLVEGKPPYRSELREKMLYERDFKRLESLDSAIERYNKMTPEEVQEALNDYQIYLDLMARLIEEDIPVYPGTEGSNLRFSAGESLFYEFSIYQKAGVPNNKTLLLATTLPARDLGIEGVDGIVSEGAKGNFILVKGNPLENLDNLKNLEGVFFAGEHLDKKALENIEKSK